MVLTKEYVREYAKYYLHMNTVELTPYYETFVYITANGFEQHIEQRDNIFYACDLLFIEKGPTLDDGGQLRLVRFDQPLYTIRPAYVPDSFPMPFFFREALSFTQGGVNDSSYEFMLKGYSVTHV